MDNYIKKWKATMEGYDAKTERFDAEERLRYDEWSGNMRAQFEAMGDWTEAAWDEFIAKAEQQWHDTVINFSKEDDEAKE